MTSAGLPTPRSDDEEDGAVLSVGSIGVLPAGAGLSDDADQALGAAVSIPIPKGRRRRGSHQGYPAPVSGHHRGVLSSSPVAWQLVDGKESSRRLRFDLMIRPMGYPLGFDGSCYRL